MRKSRSEGSITGERADGYIAYTDEEREKIIRTKAFVKQFALDERQRAKQIAATNLQARRQRLSASRASSDGSKQSIVAAHLLEGVSHTPSDLSSSQIVSNVSAVDVKGFKPVVQIDNPTDEHLVSIELIDPIQNENNHTNPSRSKRKSKLSQTVPAITILNEEGRHLASANRRETIASPTKQSRFQPVMSSVDAYLLSSSHVARDNEQKKARKKHQLFAEIEQSLQEQDNRLPEITTAQTNHSLPIDRDAILDVDSYIPLRDHSSSSRRGPIKSPLDLEIRQSTFQSYERHASASVRSTAISCLEEASFFKRKSWLKQVEMSKEMVKHRVQRRMHRSENRTTNSQPSLTPIRPTHTTRVYKSTPGKVN